MTLSRQRRHFLRGHLGLLLAAPLARASGLDADAANPRWRTTQHARAFGTRVSVTVAGWPPEAARAAAQAALEEMLAVQACANLHAPQSALSRLNREGQLRGAEPLLQDLLRQACHWAERTEGAFDITVQPLWRLYFAAAVRGELPAPDAVAARLALVGWRQLLLVPGAIRTTQPGVQATLNGLAQGYASDRAWQCLQRLGVEHALVNAGEWRGAGLAAPGQTWRIGVQAPPGWSGGHHAAGLPQSRALLQTVDLRNTALASSGAHGMAFSRDGRAHHILDPRSGRSPRGLVATTVLAPNACMADALSTACMVLGVERSLALLQATPGVEGLLVRHDGRLQMTPGWPGA